MKNDFKSGGVVTSRASVASTPSPSASDWTRMSKGGRQAHTLWGVHSVAMFCFLSDVPLTNKECSSAELDRWRHVSVNTAQAESGPVGCC